MKEVTKNQKSFKLSLIASLCFFLTYMMTKELLNLILSIIWIVIGLCFFAIYKKEK